MVKFGKLKHFFSILFFLFTLIIVSACATSQTGTNTGLKPGYYPITEKKEFYVILPQDKGIENLNDIINLGSKECRLILAERWGHKIIGGYGIIYREYIDTGISNKGNLYIEKVKDGGSYASATAKIYYFKKKIIKEKNGNIKIQYTADGYKIIKNALIMPFDVPNFSLNDAFKAIGKCSKIHYKFDVDSKYPSDAIFANFTRFSYKKVFPEGTAIKDTTIGKIYKQGFALKIREHWIYFHVDVYPYRYGSKAVINAVIPGIITSKNTIDYGIIIKEFKDQILKIINS